MLCFDSCRWAARAPDPLADAFEPAPFAPEALAPDAFAPDAREPAAVPERERVPVPAERVLVSVSTRRLDPPERGALRGAEDERRVRESATGPP